MKTIVFFLALLTASVSAGSDLRSALRAALEVDPSIASALANRDAARENVPIARARLLPQISLQSSEQRLKQRTDRGDVVQDFTGPTRSTQLTVRQGLYRRRDWVGLEIGTIQARQGEYGVVSAQSEVWSRAAAAWVDVLAARALSELYQRTVETVSRAADQARRRFEIGDGTRDAVAEAEAQLALARSQFFEANVDLEARLETFRLLTHLEPTGFEGLRLPPARGLAQIPEPLEQILARVLDTNPQLAYARANESIGERKVAQSSADHWPTLDLVGSVARAQNETANTLGVRYNNAQLGLQLVVPIYSGGGVSALERQASAAYAAAKAESESLIQRVKVQITSDWSAQTGQIERAGALLELVRAAQEQRRATELGIKAGFRTWAELGSADLLVAKRESDLVELVGTLLKTQARLLSLLPTDDPAWGRWITAISTQSTR